MPAGKITIAGCGPGDPSTRTRAFDEAVRNATAIILRTSIHPGLHDLVAMPVTITCDDLYEQVSTFDEVYSEIANRVIAIAQQGDVLYVVPGSAMVGEESVQRILVRAQSCGIEVAILPSVSAFEVIAVALGVDLVEQNVQLLDAMEIERWSVREPFSGGAIELSTSRPALVTQVHNQRVASAVKLVFLRLLPGEHVVAIVHGASIAGRGRTDWVPLSELDHHHADHLTSLWCPALTELGLHRTPAKLARIVARLRDSDGCPWDRQQTHASLRRAVLAEAYEVADAIDVNDTGNLQEELGDLLLLVAMHAQIAEENSTFTIEDVYASVIAKLVRRHPNVFGDVVASSPDAVVETWQEIKSAEKAGKGDSQQSPYQALPRSMPALMKAAALLKPTVYMATTPESQAVLESRLLELVEGIVQAGYDPESLLEASLNRRFGEPPAK